ncbi:SEL1-like repeat protein [Actinomadura hibisca]|uniref:SEL1-like repeat protein n=1 Tax=Actinomadura hibisca TaxID=68565 RepID=UPI000A5ABBCC|nr:tetratricopeptide repeat protein [Actinomadura hibisca]
MTEHDAGSTASSFSLNANTTHGSTFQQGQGDQVNVALNIEAGYFGVQDALPPWLLTRTEHPKVRDFDALELGVHRAPVHNGNAVPPYVSRDVDETIRARLAKAANLGGFVLIVGDSTAGKTRAAYEALNATLPDHRIIAPQDGEELKHYLMGIASSPHPHVFWLDNLESYLGLDGLNVNLLTYMHAKRHIIVATLRAERYRKIIREDYERPMEGSEHQHLRFRSNIAVRIIERIVPIIIQRRWTSSEIERAKHSDDRRILDAVSRQDIYGIAEYLAAGPKLLDEWRIAKGSASHPRGAALVSAAIDLRRAGMAEAISIDLIRQTHEWYLEAEGGILLRPEPYDAAVRWACERRYGVTSMLLPSPKGPSFYRVFDYLQDSIAGDPESSPIPGHVWEAAISYAHMDASALFSIGVAADQQDNQHVAEKAWGRLIENGDVSTIQMLGRMYVRRNQSDKAKKIWAKAADAGNIEAAIDLGMLFEREGNLTEAEVWHRVAANAGDGHAALHLAGITSESGRPEEAEQWFRKAATTSGKYSNEAAGILGGLLEATGRTDEAEEWLRQAAEAGSIPAIVNLGLLLANSDKAEEAVKWWLKAAKQGDATAAANLAEHYSREDSTDLTEAEKWLQIAVDKGEYRAVPNFGIRLNSLDRKSEAYNWWRRAANNGDARSAYLLGARHYLAKEYHKATEWWTSSAEMGDVDATYQLGILYRRQKKYDEAVRWLTKAAEHGTVEAACSLGRLLYEEDIDNSEAEIWLKKGIDSGHTHSACVLGALLWERGLIKEAEDSFRLAYDGGHEHAASMLVNLCAKQGRGKEAAEWMRLTGKSGYSKPRTSTKGSKKVRKRQAQQRRKRSR